MKTLTKTSTSTHTRAEVILRTFEAATDRILNTETGRKVMERFVEPALKQRVIQSLQFVGLDDCGLCHASFRLMVNWDEHELQIKTSEYLCIDGPLQDGTLPVVLALVDEFKKVLGDRGLRLGASLKFVPGAGNVDWLRKNAPPARPLRWVRTPRPIGGWLKHFKELQVALGVADAGDE